MRLFYALFFVLISLLVIILLAAIMPQVEGVTGAPHPEFFDADTRKGMLIGPANIDQQDHTRWLGYLFGITTILLFWVMLLIGNRKKEKPTSITRWLNAGLFIYLMAYTGMVLSHWSYSDNGGGDFFLSMPAPTAWMIFGVWFVPLIITMAYIFKFEDAIISDEEIAAFHTFLKDREDKAD